MLLLLGGENALCLYHLIPIYPKTVQICRDKRLMGKAGTNSLLDKSVYQIHFLGLIEEFLPEFTFSIVFLTFKNSLLSTMVSFSNFWDYGLNLCSLLV